MATAATDWYDKHSAVLRDAADGVEKVAIRYLRDKATTKAAVAVLERELRFFCKYGRRMRYASLKQGLRTPASFANKVLVNQRMKRARWSMRAERSRLQGDGRNGRRERQPARHCSLTAESPLPQTKQEYKTKNRIFTKIDLHLSAVSRTSCT